MKNELTRNYATACFELFKEEGKLKESLNEAKEMISYFNYDLVRFLDSRNIANEEKHEVIRDLFKGKNSELINFALIIIDNGRCHYLKDIFEEFIEMSLEELKIKTVKVYSSKALEDVSRNKLVSALQEKLESEIELVNIVDKSLIAGIKVEVDNEIHDLSMKRKINNLRNELLREGGL